MDWASARNGGVAWGLQSLLVAQGYVCLSPREVRPTFGANKDMDTSRTFAVRTPPLVSRATWFQIGSEPGLLMFKLAILTMLVQAVVVSTVVKGLVPSFLLILAQFSLDSSSTLVGRPRRDIIRSLALFLIVFAAWQSISQMSNVFWPPNLQRAQLISPEDPSVVLLRKSLFTQSIYLVTCVIFYLYMRGHLRRHDNPDQLLRLARVGALVFVAYGFYEVFGYALLHQNVDFLSNRITGNEGGNYSNFQRLALGGFDLVRMKSLSSEASMFAFSLLPFMILYRYQKDWAWIPLLAAVIVSTSTTAYLGLLTFFAGEALLFQRWRRLFIGCTVVGIAWLYLQTTAVGHLIGFATDKIMLENNSGAMRSALFHNSINIYADGTLLHQLFGHGFGYIRSTDGISTLLVNVGALGVLAYLIFTLYPFIRIRLNTDYRRALLLGSIVAIVTSFVSVSEFFFFQTWFFTALAWHELYRDRQNAGRPVFQPISPQ